MNKRSLGLVILVAFIGIALGGCGCFMQAQKGETPPPAAAPAVVQAPEAKPVVPVVAPPPPPPAAKPLCALNDINFDFDKYNIRERDAAVLKDDAACLQASPGRKARIEGHCDERGTVEYNLVLGQKRADSTKNFLVNLGVNAGALETVSYGKEQPLDGGHNEAAWAKNRRAQFTK
jgi:peptidoglycan-associated lipoprotein